MVDKELLYPQPIHKVCIVEDCPARIVLLLQKEGIDVFISATGVEYIDDPNIVFLVTDFEAVAFTNLFFGLLGTEQVVNPNRCKPRIMGLPYLNSYLTRHKLIPSPQPNRPRYCSLMKDVSIVIKMEIYTRERKWIVYLLQFMGGTVCREVHEATYFIADSVLRPDYNEAVNAGKTVLRPSFVLEAWRRRDDHTFDVNQEQFLEEHKLPCLEGIRIFLQGFSSEEDVEELRTVIEQCHGDITSDKQEATHIVCSTGKEEVECHWSQKAVKIDWLWTSIKAGVCCDASEYSLEHPSLSNESKLKAMRAEDHQLLMKLFDNITNFPQTLRSPLREHVTECTVTGVGGLFEEATVVRLILFNDLLLFCKVPNEGNSVLVFMQHVPFSSISQIVRIHSQDRRALRFYLVLFWDQEKSHELLLKIDKVDGPIKKECFVCVKLLESLIRKQVGNIVMDATVDSLPKQYQKIVLASMCK